ncbi:MAG: hypothetical protein AMJ79_03440 [Phycisphaerae bacterium SM23_30]|nr:MAG: hypothetical protein AMJ79_03440 [Phycisphaerae bacterium SM23_30]
MANREILYLRDRSDKDDKFTENFSYDGLGRMRTASKYDNDLSKYISESSYSYRSFILVVASVRHSAWIGLNTP